MLESDLKPLLLSVDEHNQRRRQKRKEQEEAARRTGVACPKCGQELRWQNSSYSMTFQCPAPTIATARCTNCSLSVDLEM